MEQSNVHLSSSFASSSSTTSSPLVSISNDFGFIWSCLMVVFDTVIFFLSLFIIGAPYYPIESWQDFLIFLEIMALIDFFLRVFFSFLETQPKFFVFFKFDNIISICFFILNLASSFPQVILFVGLRYSNEINIDDSIYSSLMGLKVIRLWNVIAFISKLKKMLVLMNVKAMIILKFVENFMIILLTKHVAACILMIIVKNYPNEGNLKKKTSIH